VQNYNAMKLSYWLVIYLHCLELPLHHLPSAFLGILPFYLFVTDMYFLLSKGQNQEVPGFVCLRSSSFSSVISLASSQLALDIPLLLSRIRLLPLLLDLSLLPWIL